MTNNVINIAEKDPQDQIAALTELLGCEPVFGDPQFTETCTYQCKVKEIEGVKEVFYRTWPMLGELARISKLKDNWVTPECTIFDSEKCKIISPENPDEPWEIAKKTVEQAQFVRQWRGDEIAAQYYETPWNVDGFLQQDAISWVYGSPGSYKTVMAMDLACTVATGRLWCGRKTRKGPVLYISAEGGAGIYAMRDSWEKKNGVQADHLAIFIGSPDIADLSLYDGYESNAHPSVKILNQLKNALGQPAALIVIDTYAQTSPDDTKAAVTAYENKLRRLIKEVAPGATVLVIDHTTKEGGTWMGSNAKLGNMDMMGLVKKTGDDVIVTMRNGKGKVKNAPAFDDIRMTPRLIHLGRKDAYGRAVSAPVLDYRETAMSEREALLLKLVSDGVTYGDLRTVWHDHAEIAKLKPAARKVALTRAIKGLRARDAIDVDGLQYDQTEDGSKERPITDDCLISQL